MGLLSISEIASSLFYCISNIVFIALGLLIAWKDIIPNKNAWLRAIRASALILLLAILPSRVMGLPLKALWPSTIAAVVVFFVAAGFSSQKN